MGWEPVGKCVDASKKHSQTTRRLVEDSQRDKRVFAGIHEIVKAKIGELEDTINVNDEALGDAMEDINANGKAMEGRMAAMEDDMEEMKSDMKEVKSNMKEMRDLLLQLVGVTRDNEEE